MLHTKPKYFEIGSLRAKLQERIESADVLNKKLSDLTDNIERTKRSICETLKRTTRIPQQDDNIMER